MIVGYAGLLLAFAAGQGSPTEALERNPHLVAAIAQLRQFDETGALKTLERARAWAVNRPHDLAQVHLYIGLTHAQLVHADQAVENFRTALLLDPSITLPEGASPRIRQWWTQAGGRLAVHPDVPTKLEATPSPLEPNPQPAAAAAVAKSREGERNAPLPVPLTGISIALGGAAIVVGGIGIGYGVDAQAVSSRAQNTTDVGTSRALQTRAESEARVANGLYVAAGATALVAAVVFIISRVRD